MTTSTATPRRQALSPGRRAIASVGAALAAATLLSACGGGGAEGGSPGSPGTAPATSSGAAPSGAAPSVREGPANPVGEPDSTATGTLPSVATLFAQAKQAALRADSARVTGDLVSNGTTMRIDLAGRIDGSNQRFIVDQGRKGKLELLTVARNYYVKADKTFWTANGGSQVAATMGDKYAQMPAASMKQLGDATIGAILEQAFRDTSLTPLEQLNIRVASTTHRGKPAYLLTQRIGSDGAALVVSADGQSRLLQVTGAAAQPGTLTFSDWDSVKAFTAPPKARVVKLS